MIYYTVKDGDHLSRIAHAHHHRSIVPIWNHPENKALRAGRANPHVLNPGDIVAIPAVVPKEISAATEQLHQFRIPDARLRLGLKLMGPSGLLAAISCDVQVGLDSLPLVTDKNGEIFRRVTSQAEQGRVIIHFKKPDVTMPFDFDAVLLIGSLRPVNTREGQTHRLLNLGYLLSEDDDDEVSFKSAVEEFQCDQALQIDGKIGPKTQEKLLSVHGS